MYYRKNLSLFQFSLLSTSQTWKGSSSSNPAPPKLRSRDVKHLVQHLITNKIKLGLELTYTFQASLPILPLNFINLTFCPKESRVDREADDLTAVSAATNQVCKIK